MALPSTRQFLPLPVLGLPPRQALPASPATVRSDHEVIPAVGMLLRVRAVSFQPLVMRFRWSQRCLHATIPPTVVDLTPLALPVAVLVVIGVLRRERVFVDALLGSGVVRRAAFTCEDVDLRWDRPKVVRVDTPAMQTRGATAAALTAVVALVVHRSMAGLTAAFRQWFAYLVVHVAVHGNRSPGAVTAATDGDLPVAGPFVDATSPVAAPIRRLLGPLSNSRRNLRHPQILPAHQGGGQHR